MNARYERRHVVRELRIIHNALTRSRWAIARGHVGEFDRELRLAADRVNQLYVDLVGKNTPPP